MESQYKTKLKSVVLELRHILEGNYDNSGVWHPGDLEERLASMGVRRDRESLPLEQFSHLSSEDRNARLIVDAYIQSVLSSGGSHEEALREFLQESAYTWANRLIALRCLEARGLIDEIILQKENYGRRSLKHHRLCKQNPEVCAGEDDGIYAALRSEFIERKEELPLLFQPDEPVIALKPGVDALKKCIRLLSADDEIFTAPDALGWADQYWNTEEKDRVFEKVRTVKGAKIEKSDIIPVTQLYTEPYMVKFLVQNSLGALWMAMHPESRLCESWEYYVRDADRTPVEAKPLRKVSFLDPSVGSGHFLLEAFDLLFAMYEEEGELKTPGEICEAILSHNLYGIDIDERSIQIAACALYMKAKEKDPAFRPTHINLTATNIHAGADTDHLTAFLEKYPEDKPFQTSLRLIFESLRHADELGTLLQIEEPVEREFLYLKALDDEEKAGPPQQKALFPEMDKPEQVPLPLGVPNYEEWKSGLLDRLSAHFREEFVSVDFSSRFFGEAAGKGLSLFDFLSRRYDVVATNPPYMGSKNMGPVVKHYVDEHFHTGKRDIYAAFILRCLELAKPETGRVAMVTQQSWMFLRSFADLRALDEEKLKKATGFKGILRETSIETLAHLGPGAFGEISGEVVNTVLFTLAKKTPADDHRMTAFRLIGPKGPEEKELLLRSSVVKDNQRSLISNPQQKHFVNIPLSPIGYWLRDNFFKAFDNKTIGDISKIVQQIITADNKRFLRYAWEITNLNNNWLGYLKSGGYARWSGYEKMLINWQANGKTIKLAILEKYQYLKGNWGWLIKEETFFKTGWTYTLMARGCFCVRQLSGNFICDSVSPAIIPHEECLGLSSILNSRIISYLLRSTTSEMKFRENYVARMPLPRHVNMATLSKTELLCIAHKNIIINSDLTESSFIVDRTYLNFSSQTLHVSTWLHTIEAWNDKYVFTAYDLDNVDILEVIAETGTPAGWLPLIHGYDSLPPLLEGLPEIPVEILNFLSNHERQTIEPNPLISLRQRLRSLYEAGPGVKEESDEAETDSSDDDEESDQIAIGARIPIPAETFLEELSQKMEIHPISIYWLLKEGIEQEGWRCLPEEQRLTKDRFTVLILRLLGHRWPRQVEAGEPTPEWADEDGIIPLTEGTAESTLYQCLRGRLAADYGDGQVSSQENAFEEVMNKSLHEWVKKDFFRHHISQFKKRPIAWHLSSAKWTGRPRQEAVFECIAYYHKTDGGLLPSLHSHYVGPLRKRLEMELHNLENGNGGMSADGEDRRKLLREQIQELKGFEAVLSQVISEGFGPASLRSQLRQYAINDAVLCLKAQWLKKLSGVIEKKPLAEWRLLADETGLHPDFSAWIAEAMSHLDYFCTTVGPKPPEGKSYTDDPTAKDLAELICAQASVMVTAALKYACSAWWKTFNATILKPLSERIRDAKKEQQTLKERSFDPKLDPREQSDIKRKMNVLKADIKIWQQELGIKSGQGQTVRDTIEEWWCPEALDWEEWLSGQAMHDQLSGLNGKRTPPQTIAEFVRQESLYQPDINDGVRVNIAPLQKAGLLTADVLAGKDADKALSDRAAWRDDERRWCREGKLPKPGWWE